MTTNNHFSSLCVCSTYTWDIHCTHTLFLIPRQSEMRQVWEERKKSIFALININLHRFRWECKKILSPHCDDCFSSSPSTLLLIRLNSGVDDGKTLVCFGLAPIASDSKWSEPLPRNKELWTEAFLLSPSISLVILFSSLFFCVPTFVFLALIWLQCESKKSTPKPAYNRDRFECVVGHILSPGTPCQ